MRLCSLALSCRASCVSLLLLFVAIDAAAAACGRNPCSFGVIYTPSLRRLLRFKSLPCCLFVAKAATSAVAAAWHCQSVVSFIFYCCFLQHGKAAANLLGKKATLARKQSKTVQSRPEEEKTRSKTDYQAHVLEQASKAKQRQKESGKSSSSHHDEDSKQQHPAR